MKFARLTPLKHDVTVSAGAAAWLEAMGSFPSLTHYYSDSVREREREHFQNGLAKHVARYGRIPFLIAFPAGPVSLIGL